METNVRQFGDEAMVPDVYTPLRVIRFGFPPDLSRFRQIFKVTHCRHGASPWITRESDSAVRLQQYASADERQNPRGDRRGEDQYEYRIAKIGRRCVKDVVV